MTKQTKKPLVRETAAFGAATLDGWIDWPSRFSPVNLSASFRRKIP
jgi:hypothetical protein